MAKNKLSDLNNHLFEALERLNDDKLSVQDVEKESIRCKSIIGISNQIINNAKTTIQAIKITTNSEVSLKELPDIFGLNQAD